MTPYHSGMFDVSERGRLMCDGVINYSGTLVSAVVGLLVVPIILKSLGAESYGLWIAALTVAGMVGGLDLGLRWSVTREVSASLSGEKRDDTARFVGAAANAYLALGIAGGVFIGTLGLPLSRSLQLSTQGREIAPIVFALAGVSFLADRMLAFAMGVLQGLRRFDAASLISIAGTLLRAIVIVALIAAGAGVVAIMASQVATSAITAVAALGVIGRLEPRFHFGVGRFDWSSLRIQLPFGLKYQVATAINNVSSQTAPILIGVVLGSTSIVPYHIGQRFPAAVSQLAWCVAEVLFPAASEQNRGGNVVRTRQVLEIGTRWIIVLVLPICTVLWIIAPSLLQAWLGETTQDTVLVLRLTTAAVFAEAIGAAALEVLWGCGEARTALSGLSGIAVANVGLSVWLLFHIGIVGVAWGLLISISFGSLAFLHLASRRCRVALSDLLVTVSRGLILPVVTCAATAFGITYVGRSNRWVDVLGVALAGGLAYVVTFYLRGAREEERLFAREVLRVSATTASSAYREVWRAVRRVGFIRKGYHLTRALVHIFRDRPLRAR